MLVKRWPKLLILIALRKFNLSSPAAKRFWKTTAINAHDGGFGITLDGRSVKTPDGTLFTVRSEALAKVICEEWDAQAEHIAPDTMPIYKFAVTAIDRVTTQRDNVVDELAAYGGNDMLCYREDREQHLADHQHKIWQPYIDWAAATFDVKLSVFGGIMPGDQTDATKLALRHAVNAYDDFALSGLHTLVTVSGSLILGLAAASDHKPLDDIINAAFLDELWQQEKWGYDEDAASRLDAYRRQIEDAHSYLRLLG